MAAPWNKVLNFDRSRRQALRLELLGINRAVHHWRPHHWSAFDNAGAAMTSIIVCGGGLRSGSTWQYNATRALFAATGQDVYGAWIDDYDPTRSEPVHVIKAHDPASLGQVHADKVVTCFRDLRDVVASMHRMGWLRIDNPQSLAEFLDRIHALGGKGPPLEKPACT